MIWAGAGVLWIAARGPRSAAQRELPERRLADRLPGDGGVDAGRRRHGAAVARAGAHGHCRRRKNAGEWLRGALVEPFADFIGRYSWQAALILALIAVYRISDVVMGIMANPFYVDMGYTKDEVATVTKVYGVVMTLVGAFVGGVLSMRLRRDARADAGRRAERGQQPAVRLARLARARPDGADFVVSADNLSGGIASAAFIAYLSSLTNISYSATQYALFSSLMLLLPKFIAGYSGVFVDAYGYHAFFVGTAALGVPVLLLVALATGPTGRQAASASPALAGTSDMAP